MFGDIDVPAMDIIDEYIATGSLMPFGTFGLHVSDGFQGQTNMTIEMGYASADGTGGDGDQDYFQKITLHDGSQYYRVGTHIQGSIFVWPTWTKVGGGTAGGGATVDLTPYELISSNTIKLALKENTGVAATLISQLINGATDNTLLKLQTKINAISAIVGASTPDADAFINTVAEILDIFSTYPEGANMVNALLAKVNTSDIYNGTDYLIAGKVADARTISFLNAEILSLVTNLDTKVDRTNLLSITGVPVNPVAGDKYYNTGIVYSYNHTVDHFGVVHDFWYADGPPSAGTIYLYNGLNYFWDGSKLALFGSGGGTSNLASNLVDGLMSSANYIRLLAAITSKVEIEALLTGLITSHYHNTELTESAQDGFFITDSAGAVALKYDSVGFDVAKISPHLATLISQSQVSNSLWKGKTIAFLGDSITAFAKHVNKYALLTGSTALNYGVGGTRITSTSLSDTTSFIARYSSMSDADMVIVFGGTNDFGTGTPAFGLFSDRVVTTYYGALHLLCQGLLTKYPRKPIIFMTPIHRVSEYDVNFAPTTNTWTAKTLKEYVQAIKDVCAFYSIPVLDSYSESGLDVTINGTYYFADGLHPTDFGGYKLASYMYPKLELIYNEYYVNNK